VREEDAGGREAGAHSTTPTYTVRRDGPAREPSLSAFWLQKQSILRACVREEDAGEREAGAHSTTPTYTVRRDGPAREPSLSAFWLQKPSILRACVREEDAGGREAGAHSTTPTYTVRRDGPAREPSLSAFWLQKQSILRACVREEDAGGREAGAPLDLKMPLENGRADERVSRGQASERAVCVCEAVSVEMGARRPPLPTAVVCLPGRRRRLRLAITAV
jgi:hypothetical protein